MAGAPERDSPTMSSNASSTTPVSVPPEKRAALYRLTNPPPIAWPTLAVLLFILGGVIGTDTLALSHQLPLWAASLLGPGALGLPTIINYLPK